MDYGTDRNSSWHSNRLNEIDKKAKVLWWFCCFFFSRRDEKGKDRDGCEFRFIGSRRFRRWRANFRRRPFFFPASRRHWTPLSLRTASANSARRLRTEFYRVSMVFFIQNSSTCNEPLLLAKPKVISLIEFCGTLVASLYFLAPFFRFFYLIFFKRNNRKWTPNRALFRASAANEKNSVKTR